TLIRIVVPRYGEKRVGIASLVGQGIMAIAAFAAPTLGLIFMIAILVSALSSFTFPTLTTLAANQVNPAEQGRLMGVTTALSSLMNIIGPFFAGLVYDRLFMGASYWTGALAFFAGAAVLAYASRPKSQSVEN